MILVLVLASAWYMKLIVSNDLFICFGIIDHLIYCLINRAYHFMTNYVMLNLTLTF